PFSTLKTEPLWKTQMLNDRDRAKLQKLKQQMQAPAPEPPKEAEVSLRQEFDDLLQGRKRIKPQTTGKSKTQTEALPANDYVEFRKLLLEDSGDRPRQA
ncbi:hypothetical protein NL344_27025, partial [Klebsiella pneumoniae]|nr:hypothetical protein [Klebsiella pneumoniae]